MALAPLVDEPAVGSAPLIDAHAVASAPLIDAHAVAPAPLIDVHAVASAPLIDAHAVAAAALDGLSDGVLVVADGVVLVANGAAHRLAGRAPGELAGGPAPDWVGTAAARGRTLDVTLPSGDGRRRHATVAVAPCALPGGEPGRLVTIRDRSAEAAREVELVRQAHRDGLTGLPNHRSFTARLAEESERLAARGRPLGLIVVDLDHFKAINDEHGHPVGDRVLVEAAARIASEARAIDSVGRIGGEEFAWLLPDASAGETLAAAERLRAAMRSHAFAHGLRLTASIGICDRPAPLTTLEAAHVRQHAALGAALARAALDPEQARWVRHHHERWDGAGYPDGPSGTDIPDGARTLALADAFDAMTTDRPYRAALRTDAALAEVDRLSAWQFMPGAGALLRDALRWWEAA